LKNVLPTRKSFYEGRLLIRRENVPSVERALRKLGANAARVNDADALASARGHGLPGVAFCALIRALDERELRAPLKDAILSGTPWNLLGLQALYQSSEEAPDSCGAGDFSGKGMGLPANVKLPHMGWNRLKMRRSSPLLEGLTEDHYFYFAHSFAAQLRMGNAGVCDYGAEFAAVLEVDRVCAVQFIRRKAESRRLLLANF